MKNAKLFVKLNGQVADVFGVLNVESVTCQKRTDRMSENVGNRFFDGGRNGVSKHNAFADSGSGTVTCSNEVALKNALIAASADTKISALSELSPLILERFSGGSVFTIS